MIAENCTKLKHLSLTWCQNLTDTGMNAVATHCTQLEKLVLSGTEWVTAAPIMTLARHNSATLKSLSLRSCRSIIGDSITVVAKHCSLLHALSISSIDAVSGAQLVLTIPHLKYIKKLELHQREVTDAVLTLIAEHMNMLEHLRLSANGALQFTSEGLMQIAQACEKLTIFELEPNLAVWNTDKRAALEQARPGLRVTIALPR